MELYYTASSDKETSSERLSDLAKGTQQLLRVCRGGVSSHPINLPCLPSRRSEKTSPSLVFSRVSLPEEPPTAPPQNVIASGRTNQSIMIQWQPPPESHQNGILKGYIIR